MAVGGVGASSQASSLRHHRVPVSPRPTRVSVANANKVRIPTTTTAATREHNRDLFELSREEKTALLEIRESLEDAPCPCRGTPPPAGGLMGALGGGQKLPSYGECCKPFHDSGPTPEATAEQTMRARFSAYVMHAYDFIVDTTHPDNISFRGSTADVPEKKKKKKKAAVPAAKGGFGAGGGASKPVNEVADDASKKRTRVEAKLFQDVVATATGVVYTSLDVAEANEDAPSVAREGRDELAATVEFKITYRARMSGPLQSKKKGTKGELGGQATRSELAEAWPKRPLSTEKGKGLLDQTMRERSRFVRESASDPWLYLDVLEEVE